MSQLTPEQVNRALQMRQEEYSIREIVAELRVSKYLIEKLFIEQNAISVAQKVIARQPVIDQPSSGSQPDMVLTTQPQQEIEAELIRKEQDLETERIRQVGEARRLAEWEQNLLRQSTPFSVSSPQHSRELNELAQHSATLAQDRNEFDRRQTEQLQQLQATPGQEQTYEVYRIRARQDKLVKRYNGLIQDLLDNCDDVRWSGDEVDEYLERAEALKLKIVALCNAHQIDERRLLMVQGLDYLIKDIEEEQHEQTSGFFQSSSVDFNYSPEYQNKIKGYMVETFEQQASTTVSNMNSPAPDDDNDLDDDDE